MIESKPFDVLTACVEDARMESFFEVPEGENYLHNIHLSVALWPQVWGDSSFGFAGGVPEPVEVYTVVCRNKLTGAVRVYHGGRYAYTIVTPTVYFESLLKACMLPGEVCYVRNSAIFDLAQGGGKE